MGRIHARGASWSGIGLRDDDVLRHAQQGRASGTDGKVLAARGGHQSSICKSGAEQELVWPLCIYILGFALDAIINKTPLLGFDKGGAMSKSRLTHQSLRKLDF